ncbi:sulfite exporter TauE/SafE family protein [Jannaschia sp. KMU-145]|uniref:sulfite exporter TauE/SafE family protein n=1 Tax=Jannaschia halovivens TaxID=3388667 RepID=UPI00396B2881
MPDGLVAALVMPGIGWLVAAALAAGVVYGFAGFGAALIFMPVAARVATPEVAVAAFSVSAVGSAITMLPKTWPACDKRATGLMIAAAAVTMPLGVMLLTRLPEVPLRWAICIIVAITLAAVVSGWKLRLSDAAGPRLGIGAAAGVVGGSTGLLGPVVILVTLAGGGQAARMRANLATFLTTVTLVLLPALWWQGVLPPPVLWAGLILLPIYMAGTLIGQRLFQPGAERLYRGIAYAVVAGAVVLGLPV